MIKKPLIGKMLLAISALSSSAVMAHAGHAANESLHGAIHLEHIVTLVAIGVVVFMIKQMSKK